MKDHKGQHLPKVGSPQNEKWEQREERRDILRVMGIDPDRKRPVVMIAGIVVALFFVLGILGLIIFT
ncbi:MAG: hypothetical protein IPM45_03630 [Acidimicrobiales bacterium]|nr:hypothetical protein [Acidimicrobiales bacterium]